jgi:Tfp pilus assembly protein FimT
MRDAFYKAVKEFLVRSKRQGFLLFEVILVLGLVSIVCMVSIQLHFLTRGYVRAELEALYQMCLYAQRHAIMTGEACTVVLNTDKNSYSCNGHACVLAKGVCFGVLPQVKGPPSAPQKIITQVTTFKNNQISCSPEGTIDAGTVYLTDGSSACLYALTSGVAPYSYLRKYRYAGTWQRLE